MLDPILRILEEGYQLIYEGKIEEASNLAYKLYKEKDLSIEQKLKRQLFKGIVLFFRWKLEQAINTLEHVSRKAREHRYTRIILEATYWEWHSRQNLFREIKGWDAIFDLELLKSDKDYSDDELSLFFLQGLKSFMYIGEGKIDLAIETLDQMNKILVQCNNFELKISHIFIFAHFGNLYAMKGNLDLTLKYHKLNIEYCTGKKIYALKLALCFSQSQMGDIYYQRGDLNLAIKYYEKSLKLREELNHVGYLSEIYYRFIKLSLLEKSPKKAREYLHHFQVYLASRNIPDSLALQQNPLYKLSVALILKINERIRDRAEAERLLKELIDFYDGIKRMHIILPWGVITNLGTSRYNILPIIELCDLYLQELDLVKNLKIIDDIQPLVERLINESKSMNSFSLHAYSLFLQGKISLVKMNIGVARQYLTEAQQIAEKHGFQKLAQQISSEHDKLLELISDLHQLEKKKTSLSERLNLASLDITIDQLQGRRPLEPPELINEEPILLLVMGKDGMPYFTHTFIENWNFNDIFSSFMSAFNSFSSEIFAKSIDRIKIDENTILINPVEEFLVCYVIKGQSYPAIQKLSRFSDAIKWKTEIWDTLRASIKTNQMLELNNPPSLGEIVREIFNQ